MPSSSEAKNPKFGWPSLEGLIYGYYLIWWGKEKNEKQVVVHHAKNQQWQTMHPLKDHLGECPWLIGCWWHHIPDYSEWNIKGIQKCEDN